MCRYLPDREAKKLKELELEIADDEYLFAGKQLSKKEKEDLEHKKYLLRLAKEKAGLIVRDDGYQLPQDEFNDKGKIDSQRQLDLLKARYPFYY